MWNKILKSHVMLFYSKKAISCKVIFCKSSFKIHSFFRIDISHKMYSTITEGFYSKNRNKRFGYSRVLYNYVIKIWLTLLWHSSFPIKIIMLYFDADIWGMVMYLLLLWMICLWWTSKIQSINIYFVYQKVSRRNPKWKVPRNGILTEIEKGIWSVHELKTQKNIWEKKSIFYIPGKKCKYYQIVTEFKII